MCVCVCVCVSFLYFILDKYYLHLLQIHSKYNNERKKYKAVDVEKAKNDELIILCLFFHYVSM